MANGPAATVPRPRHFYTEPEWLDVGDVRVAYCREGSGEPSLIETQRAYLEELAES